MSIKWMSIVWKLDGLYQSEKFVLLALADNANNDGQCWPSIPDIAERCVVSTRQAIRIISQLVERGYLSREMRSGKSTLYTLQTPDTHVSTTPDTHVTPDKLSPLTNATYTPDTHVSTTPDTHVSTTPDKCDIAYKEEPSFEPSFEPSIEEPSLRKQTKPKKFLTKNIYSPEFENWWKIYPPNGASKSEAAKSYQKSLDGGITHAELERGVRAYASYVGRSGVEIAHATTWLNQQRWTIDYDGIQTQKPKQQHAKQTWANAAVQIIAEDRARNTAGSGAIHNMPQSSLRTSEAVWETTSGVTGFT